MTVLHFSSEKYGRAPCHQPNPVRLQLRAPGSATPTPTVQALFSGARVGWAHFTTEHDLSSQDRVRAKENVIYPPKLLLFRKKERERESEREREIASMTGESSRARFGWPHFIAECNLPSQSLPVWSKRAGERDLYSPQLFLLRKKDFERASMTGESSRKNLTIIQASASKLSGFTPRIQRSASSLGLYARCKTR